MLSKTYNSHIGYTNLVFPFSSHQEPTNEPTSNQATF